MSETESLRSRIEILERRYRGMKGVVLITSIVIATLGIMGQARPGDVLPSGRLRVEREAPENAPIETEVRSRHFVLVDDSGKERASLAADRAGVVFFPQDQGCPISAQEEGVRADIKNTAMTNINASSLNPKCPHMPQSYRRSNLSEIESETLIWR